MFIEWGEENFDSRKFKRGTWGAGLAGLAWVGVR